MKVWTKWQVISLFVSLFISGLSVVGVSSVARAGSGGGCHFHGTKPATEATVIGCAVKKRNSLIEKGKIDAVWAQLKHESMAQIDGKNGKEWRLVFKDPAPKDKTKEKLYMFYAVNGNFIAVNHSGK